MSIETGDAAMRAPWVFPVRLVLGLAQGIALYLLYHAGEAQDWPDPLLFAPLLIAALYVPLLVSQAMGTMRPVTLAVWAVAATLIALGLGYYDRSRAAPAVLTGFSGLLPDFSTVFLGFAGLFIAQILVAAGDAERRPIAHYEAYFNAAWKLGIQLALATVFVGVFWGVLWLGAGLFGLIQLHFLAKLLEHDWFAIPATALAIAVAIELTDVRTRLVAGIRSVVLTLLGWLLPLLALIAAGFLASLFFTGLAPLWATREAAGGLLGAAAAMVVLINAAYQDGGTPRPTLLRLSEPAAAFALTPLAIIAAYALSLRVHQYGWTADRFATLYCLIVAGVYALGYGAAAILSLNRPGRMALLETANIVAAFVVLILLGSLFTPFTDPAKLSVDDQIARLRAGKVSAEDFDYSYLQGEGGRYGRRALEKLAVVKGSDKAAIAIRAHARNALIIGMPELVRPAASLDIVRNVTVYPKGKALPQSFIAQNWKAVNMRISTPACLVNAGSACEAELIDLDGDGADEVVIVTGGDSVVWWGTVMKLDGSAKWAPVATLPSPHCPGDLEALRAGAYKLVAPPPPAFRDIRIGARTITPALPEAAPPACVGR
ncbi:MAG TPA: DUF4153 domain-containing protein [Rhizomicrobium sp.]|jgi:hypothetical protein|nr:DUF4153 domain-containing protein [Rhizomicrobium sp.]